MSEIGEFSFFEESGRIASSRSSRSERAETSRTAQRRMHEERVRKRTNEFLERYRSILDDLKTQGLDRYVLDAVHKAESMLDEAYDLLKSDPFAARNISMELGQHVGPLPRVARQLRQREKEAARKAEELRKQRETQVRQYIDNLLANLRDPVERDFAIDEIRIVVDRLMSSGGLANIAQAELEAQCTRVISKARHKAREWKRQQQEEAEQEAAVDMVQWVETTVQNEGPQVDQAQVQQLLEKLRALREAVQTGAARSRDVVDALCQSEQTTPTVEQRVLDEEQRREVVRALVETLGQSGFVVDTPRRIIEADEDIVLVHARKPAGQWTSIQVGANGLLRYEFQGYEGMACKKDINDLVTTLRDVYNITLSDHRVLWQNPDRISKGARPLPGSEEQTRG